MEERFKSGELRCVVATASLELGIDIGAVDEVVLAGAPPEVASALQRAGRSGHGVGRVSRAVIYPFHGMDLLVSAAIVEGAEARDVEPLRIPRAPLDVLAQSLLAMTAEREWTLDGLYETVRAFPPFERLERRLFDATVEMLAGRYAMAADSAGASPARLRELEPRVYLDRATGSVKARDSARFLLLSSGGAIPDRGHYSMRVAGSGSRIGELDEEFVYERKVGDAFSLGTQSWRIVGIGPEAVEVVALGQGADFIPFWKAEGRFRSPVVSDRLLGLLDRMGGASPKGGDARKAHGMDREAAAALLEHDYGFSADAARAAASFAASQEAVGAGLPGRHSISVEAYADPARHGEAQCVVIHTLRGGAINEPLGLALAAAFEDSGLLAPDILSDDNFVLVILPLAPDDRARDAAVTGGDASAERVMELLTHMIPRSRLESLVRRRLEGSGLFGAEFRENAGRALLIPRGSPGKRNPLWVTRLRARRLFEAVRPFPDFPVTAETWRTCLVDLFDMDGLATLLDDLAASRVKMRAVRTRLPSPFAREAIWRETGEYMYRGDALGSRASSSVSDDVIAAALASSRLRPRLEAGLIEGFVRKAKRLLPGWGPQDLFELAEWVKERVLVPADELEDLLAAGAPGLAESLASDPTVGGRLRILSLGDGGESVFVHEERRPELEADPASGVAEWLRREGPVRPSRIASLFGLAAASLDGLLEDLEEAGLVVVDEFRRDSTGVEVVDAGNLEILLRLARRAARPDISPRPQRDLFRLVARMQGLDEEKAAGDRQDGRPPARGRDLGTILDALAGVSLPAALWETELLGARTRPYDPRGLDLELEGGKRSWFGTGTGCLGFCEAGELELFGAGSRPSAVIPAERALCDFWSIRSGLGLGTKATALAIWEEAWAGLVASEGFEPVRLGLRNRFGRDLPELEAAEAVPGPRGREGGRIPRALHDRWRSGAPVSGNWFSLELPAIESDALDEEELSVARVRILSRRHAVLARGILEHELPGLGWGALFPAMRRMELAGELVYGRFFEGLDGPQFMGLAAFELLRKADDLPGLPPLWLNALDPALPSLGAGAGAGGLAIPPRLPTNRLCVFHGRVAAVLARSGAALSLAAHMGEDEARDVFIALAGLKERAGRRFRIETVDQVAAVESPWAEALRSAGFETERRALVLW